MRLEVMVCRTMARPQIGCSSRGLFGWSQAPPSMDCADFTHHPAWQKRRWRRPPKHKCRSAARSRVLPPLGTVQAHRTVPPNSCVVELPDGLGKSKPPQDYIRPDAIVSSLPPWQDVRLWFGLFNFANNGRDSFLVVDNVSVIVPEPTSGALWILGGLALHYRPRRCPRQSQEHPSQP